MDSFPRLSIALKALLQMGPKPLALNALYRLALVSGHYKRIEKHDLEHLELGSELHALFSLPDRRELLRTMGRAGGNAVLKEADEIVSGRVRLFGARPVPLRLTVRAPLHHWTQYGTHEARSLAATSAGSDSVDIKFVWEPARFAWAFALGRAYRVSQKEKYASSFWKYFGEFDKANPPFDGPHWMNGQEVAIRLMVLVWSAQVFASSSASTAKRRRQLARSVAYHAVRLPPTLIYGRSQNNNHLLVEAAGLYTAGLALPENARAATWRDLGQRWLDWCFTHQIELSGEYIQHSSNYHRLMLQVATWVIALASDPGDATLPGWLSQSSTENLARASSWLISIMDPESGRAPNLGANDGSLLFPLSPGAFNDFRPTAQAACRAFLGASLPQGPWNELSLWLGLPSTGERHDFSTHSAHHLLGRNSRGYLRASAFKSRLAHMDQLHFDLWWRGTNVAQDAGTYSYNAPSPWDNPFTTSSVHNTVTIDGRDQMTRGGRFLTLDCFPAHSTYLIEDETQALGSILAYHRGFQRLGVIHRRLVTASADGRWLVTDSLVLTKPGEHVFRLHWLLPSWNWRLVEGQDGVRLRLKSPHGPVVVVLRAAEPPASGPARVTLVRAGRLVHGAGGAEPIRGWGSPTYGVKVPALSLVLEVTSSQSMVLNTEFHFPR